MYDKDAEIHTDITMSDALVLNSVTTKGLINSKNIELVAQLNSSIEFESTLTFNNLQASSLYSNDRISGINFTKWYESILWKNGKDIQHITGKWKIKSAHLAGDVYGNGLINGQPVNEIEKNLNKNVHEIEMALNNYSVEYRSMCEKLQYRADNYAKSSVYILKYFEEAFKINEEIDIFSYYTAHTKNNQHYLFVNTNCTTNIYKWMRAAERFTKVNSLETGVVYSWDKLESENDVFIITKSKMVADAPCSYGGTNSWKLTKDNLIHVASVSKEADILEIFVHSQNLKSFYALKNSDHVINYDVYGNMIEHWKLPYDNFTYSFVSADVLAGLNVNNGRRIFSLETKFLQGRKQRSINIDAPILKVSRNKTHPSDSPTYTIIKPEIPNYSIPTIPSKSLKTTKKIDFLSKVKDAGDVIRRSFNLHTAYMSANATKMSKFDDSINSKLLFAIKTPNITALREKFVRNKLSVVKDKNENITKIEDDQGEEMYTNKMKELKDALENAIINENSTTSTTENSILETEIATIENEILTYEFTPRVIMPESEDDDKELKTTEAVEPIIKINDNLMKTEPVVDSVTLVNGKGVRDAENYIIPEHGQGEIITLYVGTEKNRKSLYAVSRKRNSIIQGDNLIEVSF